MHKLAGVFCAFWTATDEAGEILWPELKRHLDFPIGAGVDGIMALGSTGEFPLLSLEQRKEILEYVLEACRSAGLPVIANVSDVSHRNAIHLAKHAGKQGASAASVLPPWFFPMEQRDLAEFFIAIGRESDLPLALYNFPEVTGKKIELETIRQVAAKVKVAAVKQSGAEFSYHAELLRLGSELGFAVMSGSDTRLEEILSMGCTGTVSGLANAFPRELSAIYRNFQKGDRSSMESALMKKVGQRIEALPFPLNVKAAIEARGLASGALKNPISRPTAERCEKLREDLAELMKQHDEVIPTP
jgi:dihydrodipicolinate synthase/N-acetylneuraminate lyase